ICRSLWRSIHCRGMSLLHLRVQLMRNLSVATAHGPVLHRITLMWCAVLMTAAVIASMHSHLYLRIHHLCSLVGHAIHHARCLGMALLRSLLHHHGRHAARARIAAILLGMDVARVWRVH